MPRVDGLTLIRYIRRSFRREDLAIVAFSDATQPDLSAAMIKAGANDFLHKHFLVEEFYCRILQNINMVRFVRQLRELANLDYLTHLYNRRHLHETAEQRLAEAGTKRQQFHLALLDVDHFKRINDRYGHHTGDLALQKIANTLRQFCEQGKYRQDNIYARYGGEEFICLCRLSPGTSAAHHFEALRQQMADIELEAQGERVPISVSIGFTSAAQGQLSALIDQADQAVYQAKAAGRNQVVRYQAPI